METLLVKHSDFRDFDVSQLKIETFENKQLLESGETVHQGFVDLLEIPVEMREKLSTIPKKIEGNAKILIY